MTPPDPAARRVRPDTPPGAPGLATATVDGHGVVTGWSEGARRLLGYRAEDVVGRSAGELRAERTAGPAGEGPGPCLADEPRWSGRVALCHRDGRRVEVELLAHRGPVDGGSAGWLLVSAAPREPLSREPGAPADRAFAQCPCVLAVFDTELRLVSANADMEAATTRSEDQMRGLRLTELIRHGEIERVERAMRRVLESGERLELETNLRGPGKSHAHAWSVSLAPLVDRTGGRQGVCFAARDTTAAQEARQRLLLLSEAGARLDSTLDLDRIAQELVKVAVPGFADFASIDLLTFLHRGDEPPAGPLREPITLRRAAHRSVLEGTPEALVDVGGLATHPRHSPTAACLIEGRAARHQVTESLLAGWEATDPARAARIREHGMHSVIVAPMRARGVTLGAAFFARHRTPAPFTEDDTMLAEELTARAAVCVDNARRYLRERMTAETLQRSLLPQGLPDLTALEIASRYLPSGAWAGVGGDWFDAIPLSSARAAVVVGDVVGRGIQAAATMGRLRTAVRTLADIDLPPGELLAHLDDLVNRLSSDENPEIGGAVGATCLYAVYDPVSRHCAIAAAGHPAPLVVGPEGTADLLGLPTGPPLGLGGLPFEVMETELPEGSLLALYTNGLIVGRDREIGEGLETLREVLSRPAPSLEALCDDVLRALLPVRPDDDIVLLLARTRALPADRVATWDIPADAAAVAEARRNATGQLLAWGLEETLFTTELIVSELVTNAIRYGRPPIRLRLIRDRGRLICEVSDTSNTAPHLRRARVFDEGGRGLMLVAQLATRWGTRQGADGKTIWVEQDLSPH
ncbi:SpoIIE family protein phosphatase [Streptomyces violaceusniger]|uniref:protein-serine/threonine phosphatase n=1 Tax=Streptomyces violaceusniger (strain Tu 4113) TaxID=653045 RepID=G2NZ54_STRV4|nr:SpoIIE family protein phosphatase [Streptomyces violaceusniger]AEM83097.1 putative PAS/PAC sensor protein [Streptomyces violaceusniger Tu 4113]